MTETNKRENELLKHIIKYCDRIKQSINRFGDSFETFQNDDDYYQSVSMSIYQIAELTNHLTAEFKMNNPDIKWNDIKGMRNRFAHKYLAMDEEIIWSTAKEDVPKLATVCKEYIGDFALEEA
jgi:uncharacterized protein with HEPN domain